jgi:hypothetical protein
MIIIKYKGRPTIRQKQLCDFPRVVKKEVYRMWNSREYAEARKRFKRWLPVKQRRRKGNLPTGPCSSKQVTLEKYLLGQIMQALPKPPLWKRYRGMPQVSWEDFAAGRVPRWEWDLLQEMPDFTGLFNHIFEVNDLSFFDMLQSKLEAQGVSFQGKSVYDVVATELLRLQLGLGNYAGVDKVQWVTGVHPLAGVLHDPGHAPVADDISFVLNRLPPEEVVEYFHQLVRECIQLGIIEPRTLIWDGHFIRSNCNNNASKETGQYSDPDAGYCRHIGVKKGVGYEPGFLYAYMGPELVLPVHFKMFPGNRNDNPAFRATVNEFVPLGLGTYLILLADAGPFSKETLEFCVFQRMLPVIRGRKGLKELPTRELKDKFWFCTDYIPPGWTDAEYLALYAVRPMIEKGFAGHVTFYNAKRLNTRGLGLATIHVALPCILDLLRALTAVKLRRPDLAGKLTAFAETREAWVFRELEKQARAAGLIPSGQPAIASRDLGADGVDKWVPLIMPPRE